MDTEKNNGLHLCVCVFRVLYNNNNKIYYA